MDLESLPPELLTTIFINLPGRDLARVAKTCQKFREICYVDTIWQVKCQKEYGVGPDELEGSLLQEKASMLRQEFIYRFFYTKVLYPYGYCLGVWQPQVGPYGGLVKVKVKAGAITATQYHPPSDPNVHEPLHEERLFEVGYDPEEDQLLLLCSKGDGGHNMILEKGESGDVFTMKCCKPEKHKTTQRGPMYNLFGIRGDDFAEMFGRAHPQHLHLLRSKHERMKQYDCECTYKRLNPPRPRTSGKMPVQPGLFKGTYGSHGVEYIQLTYDDDRLKGIKVSGDPNVPANKVTMNVHLDKPMVLMREQQESIEALVQLQEDNSVIRPADDQRTSQPFHLPILMSDDGLDLLRQHLDSPLDRCTHRYFATGLIAMSGFRDSSRTPAHFVVFNEDVLGFAWLELKSLSVYSRVKEEMWT